MFTLSWTKELTSVMHVEEKALSVEDICAIDFMSRCCHSEPFSYKELLKWDLEGSLVLSYIGTFKGFVGLFLRQFLECVDKEFFQCKQDILHARRDNLSCSTGGEKVWCPCNWQGKMSIDKQFSPSTSVDVVAVPIILIVRRLKVSGRGGLRVKEVEGKSRAELERLYHVLVAGTTDCSCLKTVVENSKVEVERYKLTMRDLEDEANRFWDAALAMYTEGFDRMIEQAKFFALEVDFFGANLLKEELEYQVDLIWAIAMKVFSEMGASIHKLQERAGNELASSTSGCRKTHQFDKAQTLIMMRVSGPTSNRATSYEDTRERELAGTEESLPSADDVEGEVHGPHEEGHFVVVLEQCLPSPMVVDVPGMDAPAAPVEDRNSQVDRKGSHDLHGLRVFVSSLTRCAGDLVSEDGNRYSPFRAVAFFMF
ncbi:hypothetical protein Cni_G14009 [Canna indica]|uniref:Uncharacterized protein n=1 Tax=Canna indica TaxID=4628 RepID=A0AAQ3KFL1_9LILI|nr:hypothetical protein Cni_G14009 [Canna indica]